MGNMKTLNIVGPGRVGRTLGALWAQAGVFWIQDVAARSQRRARAAVAFIGAGRAVASLPDMQPADLWLVSTPDAQIGPVAQALASMEALREGDIVFHSSGALAAAVLDAVKACGAHVASVHPLKSFADPSRARETFRGTYCVAEGDAAALAVLTPAYTRIGGQVTAIDARAKVLYHAASVVVCNDLVALMEAGLRCYEQAGLAREAALSMMEPLVRETVDNIFRLGTAKALTGPIARGDDTVVAGQMRALAGWDARIAAIYRELGAVAIELAQARGDIDAGAVERLRKALDVESK
jgi:predicted short-subunit dehydrogenase-like oxidoreductase (DUF2520 family)